jgi:hypothetical protein
MAAGVRRPFTGFAKSLRKFRRLVSVNSDKMLLSQSSSTPHLV